MDFDSFTPNSSVSANIDIDFMDQLFDGASWLQTADGSKFLQPDMNFPSYNFQATQDLVPRPFIHKEIQSIQSWEGRNLVPFASVKERLMQAISYFQSLNNDSSVLVQLWVPVKRGVKNCLVTVEQPYFHDPASSSLASYRNVSIKYEFSADEGAKEGLGLPGRVFLGKAPEWTPDVRFFRQEEYPRVNYAQLCDVRGSIALPVFEKESGSCLGVVEIVTTTQKVTYRPEVESVCKALEAVDLRCSDITHPSNRKGIEPPNFELSEISHIIRTVCDKHGLPIGQTWSPCNDWQWRADKNILCASTIDSACYVRDPKVSGFHEACFEQQIFQGQGVVGKAFTTNQPCYAIDVSAYSKAEYPLSHHAKMFGLRGAAAIHLQCVYDSCKSFVLEFFLPVDCQDPGLSLHCRIMESVAMMVQGSQNVCFLLSREVWQEGVFSGKEVSFSSDGNKGTSWISELVEAQRKGKEVAVTFEFGKEGREEFKVMSHEEDLQGGKVYNECDKDGSSFGSDFSIGMPKVGEKRRTKAQKTISLQVLRQYFAGSLKDAARSIGVCPTTLKRICRQHGITRWPSRKIKKVGHSLKKLQVVIDSVQGAQGSLQLSSFYSDFPQLTPTSTTSKNQSNKPPTTLPESNNIHIFSSGGTTSQSTSSSQTTSSSHSFSTQAKTESNNNKPPQVEPSPPLAKTIKKDEALCKVKATFGSERIRLTLTRNTRFKDLHCEVAKRFGIDDVSKMHIKYLDDDKEWVLLTCDDDLEECIEIQRSLKNSAVRLSVHQASSGGLVGSLGSRAQS